MALFYWLICYPVFFFVKAVYYQQTCKIDGSDAAFWARIPLNHMSYPSRYTVNKRRVWWDWVIWIVAYTGMGPMAILVDIVVWILFLVDRRRFSW